MLFISKVFGSRGGGIEILTMIGVQKCQFWAKSESWTTEYACCSCKLIIKNECLVYTYTYFGLSSKYSYNKNYTTPYFFNLKSNRANFAVRGPTSFDKR